MSHAEQSMTLEQDATLDEPLRRVAYEAGMLLGLEATRDEQGYHRRRLTRQQYWLHGAGTLAGMVVGIDPPSAPDADPITVRVIVGPGVGIDNLGREVLIHEPYCIDLGEWLKAQSETRLREGYDEGPDPNLLWLKVTVRHKDCPLAAQPVLARKLNLSTDAVQPSRVSDSIALELTPELPPAADARYRPWGAHAPVEDAMPALSDLEQDEIDNAPTTDAQRQLQLHARLLHALDGGGVAAQAAADALAESAQLLLARIRIELPDIATVLAAGANDPVINPNTIRVNNLLRPFLVTAGQLAWLQRNP